MDVPTLPNKYRPQTAAVLARYIDTIPRDVRPSNQINVQAAVCIGAGQDVVSPRRGSSAAARHGLQVLLGTGVGKCGLSVMFNRDTES